MLRAAARRARHDEPIGQTLEGVVVIGEQGADPAVRERRQQLLARDRHEPLRTLHDAHALDDRVEEVHLLVGLGELALHALARPPVGLEHLLVVVRLADHRDQPIDVAGGGRRSAARRFRVIERSSSTLWHIAASCSAARSFSVTMTATP